VTLRFANDLAVVFALGAILGLIALLRLVRRRYRSVVATLPHPVAGVDDDHPVLERLLGVVGVLRSEDPPAFDRIVSDRVIVTVLLLGWGYHAASLLLAPDPLAPLAAVYDPLTVRVKAFVLIPALYYVVVAEVVGTFLCLHLLFPVTICREDRLDFTDPTGFGGLRPVGVFLRNTAALYLLLLSAYLAFEAVGFGTSPTDRFSLVVLLGGTVLGVVLFSTPVYLLYRHMSRHKARKIEAVAEEIRARGPRRPRDVSRDVAADPGRGTDVRTRIRPPPYGTGHARESG